MTWHSRRIDGTCLIWAFGCDTLFFEHAVIYIEHKPFLLLSNAVLTPPIARLPATLPHMEANTSRSPVSAFDTRQRGNLYADWQARRSTYTFLLATPGHA
jgi:hypothetical protein